MGDSPRWWYWVYGRLVQAALLKWSPGAAWRTVVYPALLLWRLSRASQQLWYRSSQPGLLLCFLSQQAQ
jgi:hypothetical protein